MDGVRAVHGHKFMRSRSIHCQKAGDGDNSPPDHPAGHIVVTHKVTVVSGSLGEADAMILQYQGTGMDSEWPLPGFIQLGALPDAVVAYGRLQHGSGCASS